jgi:hypothetical protein
MIARRLAFCPDVPGVRQAITRVLALFLLLSLTQLFNRLFFKSSAGFHFFIPALPPIGRQGRFGVS